MTRKDILEAAYSCVNGDRDMQYGSPEDNFKLIAELWATYLKDRLHEPGLAARDVAAMMALFKIARIKNGTKSDNWIDLAGYAACGGEIDTRNSHDE